MPEWRAVPIRDLPRELTAQVHQKIRFHSVAMLLAPVDGADPVCCSGTLTQVNGMSGILTARHVWSRIERSPSLALLVGRQPYYIDPRVLRAFGPVGQDSLPDMGATVPDLAFVRIPLPARSALEVYGKVFYSIDLRRNDPQLDLFSETGFWILAGSPQALYDPQTGATPSLLYDTTVEKRVEVSPWDYLFVDLNLPQNPEIPTNYQGVSGGGIWRVQFCLSPDETVFAVTNPQHDIFLAGVAFYQTGVEGRQILGHGPKSLYDTLSGYVIEGVT